MRIGESAVRPEVSVPTPAPASASRPTGAAAPAEDTFESATFALDKELDVAVSQVSRGVRGLLFSLAEALSNYTDRTLRRVAQTVRQFGGLAVQFMALIASQVQIRLATWIGYLRG